MSGLDICANKTRELLGRGTWTERGELGNPGGLLCHVAHSLGSYGNGISFQVVSGQSLLLGSSLWCMHCSAKMDSSKEDSGRSVGYVMSPFDLSKILPVGGALLVLCSLPGSPIVK